MKRVQRLLRAFFYMVMLVLILDCLHVYLHLQKVDPNIVADSSFQPDTLLGWKNKDNYRFDKEVRDLAGRTYMVHFSSAPNGFRHFPVNPSTTKKRLLLLGDSFTQALDVSDDKVYFQYIARQLNYEVYACGMAGYSMMQEYLVLDQYYDAICPDWVIIQYCSNDFIDNDLELNRQSMGPSGGNRPYLQADGTIEYAMPRSLLDQFVRYSFISKRLLDLVDPPDETDNSQWRISRWGTAYPPYRRSVNTAREILQRMQQRIDPQTRLGIISTDHFNPQQADMDSIAQQLGIPMMLFPQDKMLPGNSKLEYYSGDRWHWNERGHQVYGEALVQTLSQWNANH